MKCLRGQLGNNGACCARENARVRFQLRTAFSVYNTCLRQALDHHAPFVTRTVTDRTSAPWMTLEVKQAKVERRVAERKWRQSGLTAHREIYAKQRNVVSNLISKAKKDYICEKKIIDCDSSRELFRLSNQMMGTFRGSPVLKHSPRVSS